MARENAEFSVAMVTCQSPGFKANAGLPCQYEDGHSCPSFSVLGLQPWLIMFLETPSFNSEEAGEPEGDKGAFHFAQ